MGFITLLLLLGSLSACAFSPSASRQERADARTYLEVGVGFFNDENYPSSLQAFEEASRLNPGDPEIEMHRALALFHVGREASGIEMLSKSCALRSPFPECYNNLAYLLLKHRSYAEALKAADTALESATYASPDVARVNRGLALHFLGRPREAVAAFNSTREREAAPQRCWKELYLSRSHLALANFSEAARHARIGRDLCETEPRAQFWLAYTEFRTGQVPAARDTLNEILRVFRDPAVRDEARSTMNRLNREEILAEPELFL